LGERIIWVSLLHLYFNTNMTPSTSLLALLIFLQTLPLSSSFGCPPPERLRRLLERTDSGEAPILLLPCCYDGLSARLVGLAGFDATFMTGFGVSGEYSTVSL